MNINEVIHNLPLTPYHFNPELRIQNSELTLDLRFNCSTTQLLPLATSTHGSQTQGELNKPYEPKSHTFTVDKAIR